jgi:heat shock protein HslJ
MIPQVDRHDQRRRVPLTHRWLRVPALLAVLLISGCAGGASRPLDLDGSRWRLISSSDGGEQAAATAATLEFSTDRLSGFGGCNRYSAGYSVQDGMLTAAPVVATKRACAEASANASERAWFALLSTPVQISREGESLLLRTQAGGVWGFEAMAVSP